MAASTRRAFLCDIGLGALAAAAIPSALAGPGFARLTQESPERLTFGRLEPLASMMQETSADDLMPRAVKKLAEGVPLRDLVAAAALANARTFGGEDYTGYHCEMALLPALQMADQMPDRRLAPLPVLKVLHRNTKRIREFGGGKRETLLKVEPAPPGADADALVAAERKRDVELAERLFARAAQQGDLHAFEALQALVRENIDVHQVVLSWRAWDLLQITGREHAEAMLRQSVRHCVEHERNRVKHGNREPSIRALLPKIFEEYHLDKEPKTRAVDDDALGKLAWTIFVSTPDEAACAAAEALANGFDAEVVGDAISIASVRLLLHDRGTSRGSRDKPVGSVHGASRGVHASDSANAWRGIARVTGHRTKVASLVTGAWHTAGQAHDMNTETPVHATERGKVEAIPAAEIVGAVDAAIRERAQGRAAALVERYGTLDRPAEPLILMLLDHAVTHDGALHNEKYFRTAVECYQTSRPKFRWLHLTALARVCASGFGFEAPGLAEARRLLTT